MSTPFNVNDQTTLAHNDFEEVIKPYKRSAEANNLGSVTTQKV